MGMVEKFMIGETEIEIFDDCCCNVTEEETEKVLREIELLTKEYFVRKEERKII